MDIEKTDPVEAPTHFAVNKPKFDRIRPAQIDTPYPQYPVNQMSPIETEHDYTDPWAGSRADLQYKMGHD